MKIEIIYVSMGFLVLSLSGVSSAEEGKAAPVESGGVRELATTELVDVQKVQSMEGQLLEGMTARAMAAAEGPTPLPVVPEPPVPIPVMPEAPQPLPIVPPTPEPLNVNGSQPLLSGADPLGILEESDGEVEESTDVLDEKENEKENQDGSESEEATETDPAGSQTSASPSKPPSTYEGDAAKDQIKDQVMQQLYQAYLNYYNGKHGDRIKQKIKELYEKYKAEMEKYYKALNTCPVCGLAICGGTVYYCQGDQTQTTTPMAIFINFMQIYHPDKYQEMVNQGIIKK